MRTRQVQIPYRDGRESVRQVRYKLYPNQAQLETLERWNGLHCDLYNACIEQRRRAWAKGKSLGYYDQQNELPRLKAVMPEYQVLGSHALQETVRRVDRAFQAFYRRVRAGEKPGFPRYKSRKRFVGFGYPDQAGWKFEQGPNGKHGVLHLSNLGSIKARGKPRQWGEPRQMVLTRTAHGWYATITVRCQPIRTAGNDPIGIDLGVEAVATLSDGTPPVENPRFLKRASNRLKSLQCKLSRQKRFGNRWKRTKHAIARLHQRVANQRNDFQHKLTASWVSHYGLIATETLRIKNMTARGGSRKAGLNRAILDVGMRGILQKLAYKAAEAGTRLVEVPTSKVKPSQTCPICLRQEKKPLAQRIHRCPCGCEMSRDRAAALVMLRWALDPRVYGQPPVPKGIYPWEPGGGEGLRSGPVEPRNPDHTAIAVGRG
ncbi:MAG: transposase [Thermaceae bacterium]|nr:transposase [Thermaceae bacterium]